MGDFVGRTRAMFILYRSLTAYFAAFVGAPISSLDFVEPESRFLKMRTY